MAGPRADTEENEKRPAETEEKQSQAVEETRPAENEQPTEEIQAENEKTQEQVPAANTNTESKKMTLAEYLYGASIEEIDESNRSNGLFQEAGQAPEEERPLPETVEPDFENGLKLTETEKADLLGSVVGRFLREDENGNIQAKLPTDYDPQEVNRDKNFQIGMNELLHDCAKQFVEEDDSIDLEKMDRLYKKLSKVASGDFDSDVDRYSRLLKTIGREAYNSLQISYAYHDLTQGGKDLTPLQELVEALNPEPLKQMQFAHDQWENTLDPEMKENRKEQVEKCLPDFRNAIQRFVDMAHMDPTKEERILVPSGGNFMPQLLRVIADDINFSEEELAAGFSEDEATDQMKAQKIELEKDTPFFAAKVRINGAERILYIGSELPDPNKLVTAQKNPLAVGLYPDVDSLNRALAGKVYDKPKFDEKGKLQFEKPEELEDDDDSADEIEEEGPGTSFADLLRIAKGNSAPPENESREEARPEVDEDRPYRGEDEEEEEERHYRDELGGDEPISVEESDPINKKVDSDGLIRSGNDVDCGPAPDEDELFYAIKKTMSLAALTKELNHEAETVQQEISAPKTAESKVEENQPKVEEKKPETEEKKTAAKENQPKDVNEEPRAEEPQKKEMTPEEAQAELKSYGEPPRQKKYFVLLRPIVWLYRMLSGEQKAFEQKKKEYYDGYKRLADIAFPAKKAEVTEQQTVSGKTADAPHSEAARDKMSAEVQNDAKSFQTVNTIRQILRSGQNAENLPEQLCDAYFEQKLRSYLNPENADALNPEVLSAASKQEQFGKFMEDWKKTDEYRELKNTLQNVLNENGLERMKESLSESGKQLLIGDKEKTNQQFAEEITNHSRDAAVNLRQFRNDLLEAALPADKKDGLKEFGFFKNFKGLALQQNPIVSSNVVQRNSAAYGEKESQFEVKH